MKQALSVIGKIFRSILLLVVIIVFEILFVLFDALGPIFKVINKLFYILYGAASIFWLVLLLVNLSFPDNEYRSLFLILTVGCVVVVLFFHLCSKFLIDKPTDVLFNVKEGLKERFKGVWSI